MTRKIAVCVSIAFLVGCALIPGSKLPQSRDPASPQMSGSMADPTYCTAIRGNGENVAAHWASMARLVEELGMPQAMSGGSSATVTMFFTESIAENKFINGQHAPVIQRHMQALLLKSLPIYIATMAETEGVLDAYQFIQSLSKKNSKLKNNLMNLINNGARAKEVLAHLKEYGQLFNPDLLNGFTVAPNFYRKETLSALSVFGKFDAVGDKHLFFRPGIVDFKAFALLLGEIADSYAGITNGGDQANAILNKFLSQCSENAYGKPWDEIGSDCQRQFKAFVVENLQFGNHGKLSRRLFDQSGKNIITLPTTSVISGASMESFLTKSSEYTLGHANALDKFTVDFDKDLHYGYWGNLDRLAKIKKQLGALFPEDLKSQKFVALGPANWFEVLSTSPAEPGLANIQKIPMHTSRELIDTQSNLGFSERWKGLSYRSDIVSSGGWSDLHPVLVLKAAGCENVVYINRKDGDTVFGQQVFIRLTGDDKKIPFWKKIAEKNKEGWPETKEIADLPWNRISNMGNPQSSIRRSIDEADAVYCTDWNAYDVFKGQMLPMVQEAYTAPVFVKNKKKSWLGVNANSTGSSEYVPGCQN